MFKFRFLVSLYSKYLGYFYRDEFIFSAINAIVKYVLSIGLFLIVDYVEGIPDFINMLLLPFFLMIVIPISHILLVRKKKNKPKANLLFDYEKIYYKEYFNHSSTTVLLLFDMLFMFLKPET